MIVLRLALDDQVEYILWNKLKMGMLEFMAITQLGLDNVSELLQTMS